MTRPVRDALRLLHSDRCRYCGRPYFPDRLTERLASRSWDHVLPRARGGLNEPDNLRSVCRGCNELRAMCGECVGAMAAVRAVSGPNFNRDRLLARTWFREYRRMSGKMDLQKFDAVVVRATGRLGMISDIWPGRARVQVQFGADGPFSRYAPGSLRRATRAEVRGAELEGVGGLVVRVED